MGDCSTGRAIISFYDLESFLFEKDDEDNQEPLMEER